MSYPLVEMMTWQGLGDLVNRFRVTTLNLEPVSTLWAPGQLFRLKVRFSNLKAPTPKDSSLTDSYVRQGALYLPLLAWLGSKTS